jgi:DNA-binding NtrC family response regulator
MVSLVWLGPVDEAVALSTWLPPLGFELAITADAEQAIAEIDARRAVALLAPAEWPELAFSLGRVTSACPGLPVVAVTKQGVPAHIVHAIALGATDFLDLRADDPAPIAAALSRALSRHRRANRQRELLGKVRTLNEDFLKAMVVMDHRNLELEEALKGEPDTGGPRRVLVVDDEASLATLVQMVLAEHGYEAVAVHDAESALWTLNAQVFHVVVTDKNLPGTDGISLLKEVKKLRPQTDVVVMTAYGSKESAIAALNAGAAAFLEKPFADIDDIARTVDGVITTQRAQERKREFLRLFKERNREFLEQYKAIRGELEAWLESEG